MPRICGLAILVLLGAFVALTLWAGLLYPGGTWCDPRSPGFDLGANYLCDLLHRRSLGGALNPGAPLAHAAMVCLSLALVPFWFGVAHLSETSEIPSSGPASVHQAFSRFLCARVCSAAAGSLMSASRMSKFFRRFLCEGPRGPDPADGEG